MKNGGILVGSVIVLLIAFFAYKYRQFKKNPIGSFFEHSIQKLRGKGYQSKPRTVRPISRWPRRHVGGAPKPDTIQSKKARV